VYDVYLLKEDGVAQARMVERAIIAISHHLNRCDGGSDPEMAS